MRGDYDDTISQLARLLDNQDFDSYSRRPLIEDRIWSGWYQLDLDPGQREEVRYRVMTELRAHFSVEWDEWFDWEGYREWYNTAG